MLAEAYLYSEFTAKQLRPPADIYTQLPADEQQALYQGWCMMSGYVLNFEMELYGPYLSEEQARFARYLFAKKYPALAQQCQIVRIDLDSSRVKLLNPRQLH